MVGTNVSPLGGRASRVGAENAATSGDLHVFVDEAAESISPERPDGRAGAWWGAALGWVLIE